MSVWEREGERERVGVYVSVWEREGESVLEFQILGSGFFVVRQKNGSKKSQLTPITFFGRKKSLKQSNNKKKKHKRPLLCWALFVTTWRCWLFLYKERKQNTRTDWFPANFKTFVFVKKVE